VENKTPKIITARRVISREMIERIYTQDQISHSMHLSAQFFVNRTVIGAV
jgi:hypothetical protein